jgi:hypothetical protein
VDPFGVLGLSVRPDLTDDDVRSAWRRIAAATHPDRADGGDPERYAVAAAAYTTLRTRSGRGEAYADLGADQPAARQANRPVGLLAGQPLGGYISRIRRGRPAVLALRVLVTVVISFGTYAAAGFQPAAVAVMAGLLTWLLLTGRSDLALPA